MRQKTAYTFEVSVWELFLPLLTGVEMVLVRPGGYRDPAYLVDLIRRRLVTVAHFVPSMLRIFLDEPGVEECKSLRRVFAIGESLSSPLRNPSLTPLRAQHH